MHATWELTHVTLAAPTWRAPQRLWRVPQRGGADRRRRAQSVRVVKLMLSLLISFSMMSATAFLAFCATLLQYSDDPDKSLLFCTDCPGPPGAFTRPSRCPP